MIKLTEDIAELIGLHTGDGTLYNTSRGLVWELRGSLQEKCYYDIHITSLMKRIFLGESFNAKFRSGGKHGCYGIQSSKKCISKLLIDLGFSPGTKTYSVRIPEAIKSTQTTGLKFAFLRGLFDTDGCLRFDKLKNNKLYTYPKIEFDFASKNLRDDLFTLLNELKLNAHIWGKLSYHLCLPGEKNLHDFMYLVKPKNTKHLKKYLFWCDNGCYVKDAAVA